MNVQVALTPAEGKRLIGKAVAGFIKDRVDNGAKVLITRGSTNAYVLEETMKLMGAKIDGFELQRFITGWILPGKNALSANKKSKILPEMLVTKEGIVEIKDDEERMEIIRGMQYGDVIVKGANAIDSTGMAGVLLGNQVNGGTIGIYPLVKAKGIDLVIPVGLEKMVASEIVETSQLAGARACLHSTGMACGLLPISGITITEIEAVEMLFPVTAFHMASGGLGGAQGSVVLLIEGDAHDELRAFLEFFDGEISGEKALSP